jgi:Cof subfamily protein (haloacid dehalogenase superfamily)
VFSTALEEPRVVSLDKRTYRIVALDLDGTLLNRAGEVSSDDAAALRRMQELGALVVLASGRMCAAIRPWYHRLGVDGPVLAYNGGMVRDSEACGEAVLFEKALPARYGDWLIDYADEHRFHLNYYVEDTLYAKDDPELRRFADLYAKQTGSIYHFVPSLQQFKGREPTKIILITDPSTPGRFDPRRRDELYDEFSARWDGEVSLFKTNPEYLEFLNRGTDKGVALAALAGAYSTAREEVIAFGDGDNDAPMLAWAGFGVAVANAMATAREAADLISPCSNDESAVARTLEQVAAGY